MHVTTTNCETSKLLRRRRSVCWRKHIVETYARVNMLCCWKAAHRIRMTQTRVKLFDEVKLSEQLFDVSCCPSQRGTNILEVASLEKGNEEMQHVCYSVLCEGQVSGMVQCSMSQIWFCNMVQRYVLASSSPADHKTGSHSVQKSFFLMLFS